MPKPNASKTPTTKRVVPIAMTADDDILPHYDLDFSQAKPNYFAKRTKVILGAQSSAKKGSGRKPATEPLITKRKK